MHTLTRHFIQSKSCVIIDRHFTLYQFKLLMPLHTDMYYVFTQMSTYIHIHTYTRSHTPRMQKTTKKQQQQNHKKTHTHTKKHTQKTQTNTAVSIKSF